MADSASLVSINGVGPATARKIIRFRNALGGFHSKIQLKEIYGMRDSIYTLIENEKGGLFVSTPVVMEVYFTLTGSVLAFSDEHALEALDAVLRLPGVEVQQANEVFAAIAYARQGLPFKDACVLAFSADASRLVTFDKPFAKRAAKLKLRPVVQVP